MATLAVGLSMLGACADGATNDGGDPEDASADVAETAAKADGLGYVEGSPLAIGILAVANTASLADLEHAVHVTVAAAKGIVADRPFATLAALDAVPYVGAKTFARLATYAEAHGDVPPACVPTTCAAAAAECGSLADGCGGSLDCGTCAPGDTCSATAQCVPPVDTNDPFPVPACTGDAATVAQLASLFAPGASEADVGTYTIEGRTRACTQLTGCEAWRTWIPPIASENSVHSPVVDEVQLVVSSGSFNLNLVNQFCTTTYHTNEQFYGLACSGAGTSSFTCDGEYTYDLFESGGRCNGGALVLDAAHAAVFTGKLAPHCLELRSQTPTPTTLATWTEYAVDLHASF